MTAIYAERCAADEIVGGKQSYSVRNVFRFADTVHHVQASQAACIVDAASGTSFIKPIASPTIAVAMFVSPDSWD